MTAPPRRRRATAAGDLTGRELGAEVSREVARIQAETQVVMPTGRCRICQHPESRSKINTLLGYGLSNVEILEFAADINEKRSKNNKITLDVLKNHKQRHFNVQAPTQAGFRRIMERRKAALTEEFGEASANLLTGMAYLDVVAQKGWQHLINEETVVDYETGLKAMLKLEDMQRDGQFEEQVAQMRREVGLLQQAVTDVVPEEYLAQINERIGELTGSNMRRVSDDSDAIVEGEVIDADGYYDQDDDDEGWTPPAESDEGDSIED